MIPTEQEVKLLKQYQQQHPSLHLLCEEDTFLLAVTMTAVVVTMTTVVVTMTTVVVTMTTVVVTMTTVVVTMTTVVVTMTTVVVTMTTVVVTMTTVVVVVCHFWRLVWSSYVLLPTLKGALARRGDQ